MDIGSYIMPAIICGFTVYALCRGVDVFGVFIEGAKEGLKTGVSILPALVALMTCVGMLKASGALDIISYALEPLAGLLGLPRQALPLAMLRPVSGSGAMAVFKGILDSHGPDSYIGRVASVMMGSTETTFYTIAIYCGAIGVTKTRHMLPAGLTADLTGFIMSAITVRLFFYG